MKKFSCIGMSKMLKNGKAVWFCPWQGEIEAPSMRAALELAESKIANRKFNHTTITGEPLFFSIHEIIHIMDMGDILDAHN